MPLKSLSGLPAGAKALFERTMSGLKGKGYSDSKRAKIAWETVKRKYKKEGDKWILKKKEVKKSFPVDSVVKEKSIDGETYLEGYIFKYTPDTDDEVLTREFAERTFEDWKTGDYYHEEGSEELLTVEEKKIDDEGLWAKVKVNKNNPYYEQAIDLIKKQKENLAFSPRFSSPMIGGQELRKKGDKWYLHYIKGEGRDFALTVTPRNRDNKVKIAG